MNTSIFICPQCGQPGEKKVKRAACVSCFRVEQRQRWHERKARSLSGSEQVSISGAGGWDGKISNKHLMLRLI